MLPEDKQLEIEIDRELKALPQLSAPVTLLAKVMAAIAARLELPWYRRAWQTWPNNLRWSSLALLLISFGAICYAGWGISHTAVAPLSQEVSAKFAGVAALWGALNDVLSVIYVSVRNLGTGTLIGICAALLLGYAMFLALGAVYFRIAFAPSKSFAYENH
jgi:hypothetical protein